MASFRALLLALWLVVAAVLPSVAAAQWRTHSAAEKRHLESDASAAFRMSLPHDPAGNAPKLRYVIAGGVVAWGLGMAVVGAFAAERVQGFDYRAPAVGGALAIPLRVHLANERRGNLPLAALVSAGIGAGVVFGGFDGPDEWPVLLVAAPVAELTAAVLIERFTADDDRVAAETGTCG